VPNFIEIEGTFRGQRYARTLARTYVHRDRHLRPALLGQLVKSRPQNHQLALSFFDPYWDSCRQQCRSLYC